MPGQRDVQKFTEVVNGHYERLFRGALSVTGDRYLAEEIVQDTFILAFRKFDTFTGRSSVFTWLYGIMLNKYRDHCRKGKLLRRLGFCRAPSNPVEIKNVKDESCWPADKLANRDDTGVIVQAVEKLPFKLRTVVTMHYFDDLSLSEIAAILNCCLGTVKSRLFNARKRLHRALKGKLGQVHQNALQRS